ncbi:MAG: acetylxylan esterase [bacterium]|nr:acetylxylan esterase [bacterium]
MQNALVMLAALVVFGLWGTANAVQLKELDSDVNYDEDKVPHYDLPPLLVTAEGAALTTPEAWMTVRRPQILSLFANTVYGHIPVPETPIKTEYEVIEVVDDFMDGKATRLKVEIRFQNEAGKDAMTIAVFVPNKAKGPAPAVMHLTHDNPRSRAYDASRARKGKLHNGWPVGLMIDRGYAVVAANVGELMQHNEIEFLKSIHRLYFKTGQSFPKAHEWGVLTAIGWGAMRTLDYLETLDSVDHERVALFGHSMLGKSALWAAAQDQRFGMVVSAQSGCGGAALWRRRSGETMEKMVTRFPYWLCRNAWKFAGREDDLPVDQHMLLALIAPRPLYVFSGVEDRWADPRGEYLGAYHASEVYRLLGKTGLSKETSPPIGEAIIESDVGYHVRKGGHSVEQYDWERILDFADYHFGTGE